MTVSLVKAPRVSLVKAPRVPQDDATRPAVSLVKAYRPTTRPVADVQQGASVSK